ncbi:MAG: 8-oxo-dGTP diphosphatase MutT [Proteobacteria bacterium]|nr:8-oxo-dGTP diphosphatase MutT [Pseudomonadota bacterium]
MEVVHVAVGVILNDAKQILLARRPVDSHQGGLWEFPGGKVEQGEELAQALSRELKEELGIDVHKNSPLLQVHHDYGDKAVLLDVCVVWEFGGVARGLEGQALRWVEVQELNKYAFPAANKAIVAAVSALLGS